MINYPIKTTKVNDSRGYIIHTMADDTTREYSDVRMGLVWPSAKSPAYFVVVGEEYLGIFRDPENPDNRGELTIMNEQEFRGLSVEMLCSGVFDAAAIYGVRTIYADYDEKDPEYFDALTEYGYRHKLKSLRVIDAPFKKNFHAGLAQVSDWERRKLLKVPEGTVLHSQIRGMSKKDLDQTDPELIFYAANALRYVVSGFYKFRPTCYRKRETWRRKNRRGMAV